MLKTHVRRITTAEAAIVKLNNLQQTFESLIYLNTVDDY